MSMKKTASSLGLVYGDQDRVYNSRLAQELRYWAETENRAEPFNREVFKTYFAEGKNIGEISVLMEIAASAGLPKHKTKSVLETREYKDMVDRDWALSRENGILAAPTFVIHNNRLVGAQPYDQLKRFMDKNSVKKMNGSAT